MSHGPRMLSQSALTNPLEGSVHWSPVKSIWYTSMALIAVVAGPSTWTLESSIVAFSLTTFTLCLGHSIGFHRLLIHRSFQCPTWLEYALVTIGAVVSMGGPTKMQYLHDILDW